MCFAPPTSRSRSERAFTLIEMVVAIAIIAVLVGAAVPVTSKILTYQARKATREELEKLSDAACDYFRDTQELPAKIADLLVDPGAKGWSGPYLPGVVADQLTGLTGYEVDAWSRAYKLTASGDVLTITSAAEDASFGDASDVAIDVNVTWIRREETLDQLKTINQAIGLYNSQYQATAPLSSSWPTALDQLVAKGFLPSTEGYQKDAWGAEFVGDPPGKSPLVKVQSPTLSKDQKSQPKLIEPKLIEVKPAPGKGKQKAQPKPKDEGAKDNGKHHGQDDDEAPAKAKSKG